MTEEPKDCGQCGHLFDPHLVLATTGDPAAGGIILCQVKGCDCYSTWAAPQLGGNKDTVHVPSSAEIAALRLKLQTE